MNRSRRDDDGAALRARICRLELMLQEANHRIANSLQFASSLAAREARTTLDPVMRSRLGAMQNYLEAVANVHQLLGCRYDADTLPLDVFLQRLVAGLQSAARIGSCDRRILLRCDGLQVSPEAAVWIGMIVIELVHNACKYAYGPAEPGDVRVTMAACGRGFMLKVSDDGVGLDPAAPPRGTGLGQKMILAMARRLEAEFSCEPRLRGTTFVLRASGLGHPADADAGDLATTAQLQAGRAEHGVG